MKLIYLKKKYISIFIKNVSRFRILASRKYIGTPRAERSRAAPSAKCKHADQCSTKMGYDVLIFVPNVIGRTKC